ncbi:MAG: 5'-deoxyadenosine deaminase [Deltaproteobacteria bacterium]|nr:5'-deoxyadenosine deaminase [Deltaproteobacteria bacterium]
MSPTILVRGGVVLTVDPRRPIVHGDVLVEEGRLAVVGGAVSLAGRRAAQVLDATGCAVLPGLVQTHVHLCQVLLRGMADDLSLLDWLRRRIWPLEAAHDERSLEASARLGIAELIRGGTTTVLDMGTVRHHDVVFEALAGSGLRAFSGKAMMDAGDRLPRRLRETTRQSLEESRRLWEKWDGAAGGRIHYAFAPRFALSCSDRLLGAVAQAAKDLGAIVHTHAAENRQERALVRRAKGVDDVMHLERMGISGPRAVLAHGVHLTDREIRRMARLGTRVVHCPSANLKLGSGIARIPKLLEAGVEVGIGADGAPCNNNLDALREVRLASLLAKAAFGPTALAARTALELATIRGARLLGLDREIGTIEVGKRADLTVLDLTGLHSVPPGDPYATVVYAARGSDVRHVLCDGRVLLSHGRLTTVDEGAVREAAMREAPRLLARAKLQ